MFLIINSLLQSIIVNRANIDTRNFINYSILPNSMSTFELNGSVEVLSLATRIDQYPEYGFRIEGQSMHSLGSILGRRRAQRTKLGRGECFQ